MSLLSRLLASSALLLCASSAHAQVVSTIKGLITGDWALTVGGSASLAPRYMGASGGLAFFGAPMVSMGKSGRVAPFQSRSDNISFALIDTDMFRMGPVGKILFSRQDSDRDLRGLGTVKWGAEVGGFIDIYPTSWLRLRGEVRQGFRAHSGVVADFSADVFHDITPTIRLSGGPRLTYATDSYYRSYFGVNATQSAASGLAVYSPGSGIKSAGIGGAITWKATDKLTTSLFAEYSRLMGPAADSSLVKQRGDVNQYLIGVSATYRFDFRM